MNTWITGIVIGIISTKIIQWWRGSKTEVKEYLQTFDDKINYQIQKRWNWKLPEEVSAAYDWFIGMLVDQVDKQVGDGAFIRTVIRAIEKRDASKIPELLRQLANFRDQIAQGILDNVPPELKGIINEEKEKIAVRVAFNKIPTLLPSLDKPKTELVEDIKRAATANKINQIEGPITKEFLDKLLEESQKRQANLKLDRGE